MQTSLPCPSFIHLPYLPSLPVKFTFYELVRKAFVWLEITIVIVIKASYEKLLKDATATTQGEPASGLLILYPKHSVHILEVADASLYF